MTNRTKSWLIHRSPRISWSTKYWLRRFPSTECVVSTNDSEAPGAGLGTFDPAVPHRCSPLVAVRPEPFGALVYHFGTRRLSFLKTPELVAVVSDLSKYENVYDAVAAVVPESQRLTYLRALAGLAKNGTIEPRQETELT